MKTRAIIVVLCALALSAMLAAAGPVSVTNVLATQRPVTPLVDIAYDLSNPSGGVHNVLIEVATNTITTISTASGTNVFWYYNLAATNFAGDVGVNVGTGVHKTVEWFAAGDITMTSGTARARVTALEGTGAYYCIVDVSGGQNATTYPVTYQQYAPPLNDTYKTTKIVLRRIPNGSFVMGSPAGELGRGDNETQHNVTLTQPFYIGIYEITQAQYSNVMGSNPSYFQSGAHAPKRPVESVSWNTERGGTWPGGTPGSTTFMGKLRSKTGLNFDLPTEAQWEYACRAGTTKALNNNTDLQSTDQDPNMDILGRYWYNGGSNYDSDPVNGGTAAVASYLPNQWGLYDMHGNVWEWCLDWYGFYGGDATDPGGPASGSYRVLRGGSWIYDAGGCRSAYRGYYYPDHAGSSYGFRLVLPAGQ